MLLFELRGHGARLGPCTFGIKESQDARAILAWGAEFYERVGAFPKDPVASCNRVACFFEWTLA